MTEAVCGIIQPRPSEFEGPNYRRSQGWEPGRANVASKGYLWSNGDSEEKTGYWYPGIGTHSFMEHVGPNSKQHRNHRDFQEEHGYMEQRRKPHEARMASLEGLELGGGGYQEHLQLDRCPQAVVKALSLLTGLWATLPSADHEQLGGGTSDPQDHGPEVLIG